MIKILFICHGNICRSPMAEFVFRKMAADAGLSDRFFVGSAATTDEEIWNGRGNPVYPPVARLLKEHGMDPGRKRATLLRPEDYSRYDCFIGMDEENRQDMERIFRGDPEGKCSLLMVYTGFSEDLGRCGRRLSWIAGIFHKIFLTAAHFILPNRSYRSIIECTGKNNDWLR